MIEPQYLIVALLGMLVFAILVRKIPGVSLWTFVLFLIGLGLGLFVPMDRLVGVLGKIYGLGRELVQFVRERYLPESPGEIFTSGDLLSIGLACAGGIMAALFVRRLTAIAIGFFTGVFLQALLVYSGLPPPIPWW